MPKQSISTLKNWFKKGLKPLESQFADWLDSYWHKDASIPMNNIQDLISTLNDTNAVLAGKEDKAQKGFANGYASLDGTGKVPSAQLPEQHFRGKFTSLANLQAAIPVGNDGDYAVVDVDGTDAQQYIWDQTDDAWVLSSDTGGVTTFNGRIGAVTSQAGDYTVAQVTGAEATASKGAANGYAGLGANGKVPAAQLDIHDALDQVASGKVLDARQGKLLADLIADRVQLTAVYNALDQILAGKVLDARQGRTLKLLIDGNTTAIGQKADTSYVNTELAKKANYRSITLNHPYAGGGDPAWYKIGTVDLAYTSVNLQYAATLLVTSINGNASINDESGILILRISKSNLSLSASGVTLSWALKNSGLQNDMPKENFRAYVADANSGKVELWVKGLPYFGYINFRMLSETRNGALYENMVFSTTSGTVPSTNIVTSNLLNIENAVSGTSVAWGLLTGNIEDQADLITYISGLLGDKVNIADVYNALDQLAAGKVLDARQGKALKDLIDTNASAIAAINALLTSDNINLDTLQEIVDFIEEHESDITSLLSGKVNTADVYNALDQLAAGKVLDARQGKALKDLIDANTTAVGTKLTGTAASDAETQIVAAVSEDNKFVSRLKHFNWWTWIKTQAQTIAALWTFNDVKLANQAAAAGTHRLLIIDDTGKILKETNLTYNPTTKEFTAKGLNTLSSGAALIVVDGNGETIAKFKNDKALELGGTSAILEVNAGIESGNAAIRFLTYAAGSGIGYRFQDAALNDYITLRSLTANRAVTIRQRAEYNYGKGEARITDQFTITTDGVANSQNLIFELELADGEHCDIKVLHAKAIATDGTSIASLGIDAALVRKVAATNIEGNTSVATQNRLPTSIVTGGFNWNIDTSTQKIQYRFQTNNTAKTYTVWVDISYVKRVTPEA